MLRANSKTSPYSANELKELMEKCLKEFKDVAKMKKASKFETAYAAFLSAVQDFKKNMDDIIRKQNLHGQIIVRKMKTDMHRKLFNAKRTFESSISEFGIEKQLLNTAEYYLEQVSWSSMRMLYERYPGLRDIIEYMDKKAEKKAAKNKN